MKYEKPEIVVHNSTDATEWAVPKSSYTAQQFALYACNKSSPTGSMCTNGGAKAKSSFPKNDEILMSTCHCTKGGSRVSYGAES